MKYCGKCGTQLNDDAMFCANCGAQVGRAATPNQRSQPATTQGAAPTTPYSAGLKTNRGLLKFVLLSIITLGIYAIVVMTTSTNDLNTIASRYDGKKTMHYCLLFFLVGPITLEIYTLIWNHKMSDRIGMELRRRRINYDFGPSDFWLWGILGSLILVGPFIYRHKHLKSMNLLCADYNSRG